MEDQLSSLIYDWNVHGESQPSRPAKRIEFDDETLRDGLQSPSVSDPSLDDKIRILHFMERIGVDTADIGLPGAGPHVQKTVERLAIEIRDNKMKIAPAPLAFPLMRRYAAWLLQVSASTVERGLERVRQVVQQTDCLLADGRPFLASRIQRCRPGAGLHARPLRAAGRVRDTVAVGCRASCRHASHRAGNPRDCHRHVCFGTLPEPPASCRYDTVHPRPALRKESR